MAKIPKRYSSILNPKESRNAKTNSVSVQVTRVADPPQKGFKSISPGSLVIDRILKRAVGSRGARLDRTVVDPSGEIIQGAITPGIQECLDQILDNKK